jgi:hypothetical protein
MLEEKVNQILSEEQSILAEIDSYDVKKKVLSDKFEQDVKSLETEKNRRKYQLKHFYQMNISVLFEKVVEVIKTNDQVPTPTKILSRYEGNSKGIDYYQTFSLFKNNAGKILMIPEEHECCGYRSWYVLKEQQKIITFEELIYDDKTKNTEIRTLYSNLKKIIQKYGEKDGKETGNN